MPAGVTCGSGSCGGGELVNNALIPTIAAGVAMRFGNAGETEETFDG